MNSLGFHEPSRVTQAFPICNALICRKVALCDPLRSGTRTGMRTQYWIRSIIEFFLELEQTAFFLHKTKAPSFQYLLYIMDAHFSTKLFVSSLFQGAGNSQWKKLQGPTIKLT